MPRVLRSWICRTLVFSMALLLGSPQMSAMDEHVVRSTDLHRALLDASQARQHNIERVLSLLSTEPARSELDYRGLDSALVERALPLLSDEELASLAERAREAQSDFAAGALNNQQLTYIIIALGTAVFILIIVAAR